MQHRSTMSLAPIILLGLPYVSLDVVQSFDYEFDNSGHHKKVGEAAGNTITWDYDNLYGLKTETFRNGRNSIHHRSG